MITIKLVFFLLMQTLMNVVITMGTVLIHVLIWRVPTVVSVQLDILFYLTNFIVLKEVSAMLTYCCYAKNVMLLLHYITSYIKWYITLNTLWFTFLELPCQRNNGGCRHICTDTLNGAVCSCHSGYEVFFFRFCAGTNQYDFKKLWIYKGRRD